MFQLMIVDDEPSAVDSLAATLPWAELDIEGVHCAYSGKEALQLAEIQTIDILITDIRMPGIDGIELIRRFRELSPRTACILLTGYAEFDYAKRAIELQTVDYLLKPVSDDKLMETIRGVTERLKREWEQLVSFNKAQQTFREHLPMLKAGLLQELLVRRTYPPEALDEKLGLLDLPIRSGDALQLFLLRPDGAYWTYDERDRSLVDYAIVNIAEEALRPFYQVMSCKDAHNMLVIAAVFREADMTEGNSKESAARIALQLQSHVHSFLKVSLSVVVGARGIFPQSLGPAYREALALFRRRIGDDEGLLMTVGELTELPQVRALQALHEPPSLLHLFEAGVWEETNRKLQDVFEELADSRIASAEHLAEVYHTITSACYHYAHLNGNRYGELFPENGQGPFDAGGLLTYPRLKKWAFALCERLFHDNRREMQDSRSTTIKDVIDYIHAHLEEDVSLQTLADRVGWHPVYLSKVFKLEAGESLSDYLFRVRMDRAVQLLRGSDMKIYEITAKVGYLNTPHFIKVFKRTFGVTPQEYREGRGVRDETYTPT